MDDLQADFVLMCRNAQTYNIEGSIVSFLHLLQRNDINNYVIRILNVKGLNE